MELLADPKHLGAEPGFLLALHTWGRSLSLHPHIHCLITDGGLAAEQWREPRGSCFLPARIVMAKFRGKFLWEVRRAIVQGTLRLPGGESVEHWQSLLNKLGRKKWNVHLRERYRHGDGVIQYLARYVRGGPLRNGQLVAVNEAQVTYRYCAHNSDGAKRAAMMTLAPDAFIRRYLQHVPEPGRHILRGYGLYAHTKTPELDRARNLFHQPPFAPPARLTGRLITNVASRKRARTAVPSAAHPWSVPVFWRPAKVRRRGGPVRKNLSMRSAHALDAERRSSCNQPFRHIETLPGPKPDEWRLSSGRIDRRPPSYPPLAHCISPLRPIQSP